MKFVQPFSTIFYQNNIKVNEFTGSSITELMQALYKNMINITLVYTECSAHEFIHKVFIQIKIMVF